MDQSVSTVLVVDDDRTIARLVKEVLVDEGYAVSLLSDAHAEAVKGAIATLEPDCVLLDGGSSGGYGTSWLIAEWLATRARAVPVVMFTAHHDAADEATTNHSARSQAASFAAVLSKPFDLTDLLRVVEGAVGHAAALEVE